MAFLESLQVAGLRNISALRIDQLGRVNLFCGTNGAGKTTVLEAIHLLALARSFRAGQPKVLVNHGMSELVVFGVLNDSGGAETSVSRRVGVKKDRKGSSAIQIDGQVCRSAAQLAEMLPIQLIDSSTFELVIGQPAQRRQYLDWGLFHVEQSFYTHWQRLQRVLKQRNNLLRRGKIDVSQLDTWDAELVSLTEKVTSFREGYISSALPLLLETLSLFSLGAHDVSVTYYRGWDGMLDYREALRRGRKTDCERGFTSAGAHRADLRIRVGGQAAAQVLSRGQVKALAIALRIAQARFFGGVTGKRCIFLVDDLASELDELHKERVCEELGRMECQLFMTSIQREALLGSVTSFSEPRMFHVEHGLIEKI